MQRQSKNGHMPIVLATPTNNWLPYRFSYEEQRPKTIANLGTAIHSSISDWNVVKILQNSIQCGYVKLLTTNVSLGCGWSVPVGCMAH